MDRAGSPERKRYLGCLGADDARNEAVARERAGFSATMAQQTQTMALVYAAFRTASDEVFTALLAHPDLAEAAYALGRLRELSARRMSAELEQLAAELAVDGISAWGRLYDQVAGRLEFDLERPDGTVQRTPMAQKRSLTENPDPAIRRAALEGSNQAWAEIEPVAAQALNAIAGTRLALYRRRGVEHFLDQAVFDSGITRATLDAMMEAIRENFELPRRYLRTKARLLGVERLGFQDLSSPLPFENFEAVPWHAATDRILDAFGRSYPALADFTRMAFDSNWVESEPRSGKSPGGFCTSSSKILQSRIFMTYGDTLGDVQTLAHELGHAFHNWVMRDMRPYARRYPMTLAETASTFAETLFTDAILEDPNTSVRERALVLDTRLDNASAFLLNIPMRFLFEKAFYEERAAGEVPAGRLKELILEAQRTCYGDVLADDQLDPYFWASKLHFYISGVSFYNFPYSFGYLFSLAVYARAADEGAAFLPTYEKLLRATGRDTAENVARNVLGVDLESVDFWRESIGLIESDLERFEATTGELFA